MVITNPTAHGKTSQHPPICSNPSIGAAGDRFRENQTEHGDILGRSVFDRLCMCVCACLVLLSCSVLVPSLAVGKVPPANL